jgi:limonene 1,2-monooxygenase
VQTAYDKVMAAGTTYVDATLNAQLTEIGKYQAEREAKA